MWHGKVGDRPDAPDISTLSMSEQEILTYSPLIKGYALSTKQWCRYTWTWRPETLEEENILTKTRQAVC